ncbi:hypothetical protein RJ641_002541 [Dillenia turbinata]|uniref:Uncharacterized protein n=1 Tax=Dillenia turbinata TaxID=194707 RepID=A0AAN8VN57_9MAGN
MQGVAAALCFAPSTLPLSKPLPSRVFAAYPLKASSKLQNTLCPHTIAISLVDELLTIDYTEASETIGGEACAIGCIQKQSSSQSQGTMAAGQLWSRVFPAEGCDDRGGEFCERSYQRGVY